MAYKIIEKKYIERLPLSELSHPLITAVMDSPDDLASLGSDYCPGSIAMVADKGVPAFMLNSSGKWKEI